MIDTTAPPEVCVDAARDRLAARAGERLREAIGDGVGSVVLPDVVLAP